MSDCGFEPDRVQAWLTTPIGAKVADDNPAYQRAADVMVSAMAATGADQLAKINLLVKGLAMTIGTMGLGSTDRPADGDLKALCDNLGAVTFMEATAFCKRLRRDIRASKHRA